MLLVDELPMEFHCARRNMQDVTSNVQCLLSKYVVTDCFYLCHGARRVRLAGIEG